MLIAVAVAEFLVGGLLALAGNMHWTRAEEQRKRIEESAARMPRIIQFLSPPSLFAGRAGLSQVRATAAVGMAMGLFLIAIAVFTIMSVL